MKHITTFLLTSACALTITNNSFGMLAKTSSIKQIKKIRSFHTSKPMLINLFDIWAWEHARDASEKADGNQNLLQENNKMFKENNELLRAIIKQNYLLSYRAHYEVRDTELTTKLNALHDSLEKKYNIKIKNDE